MKRILFFGDSITDMSRNFSANIGDISSYGNGYVFLTATELQSKFPGEYEIINRGISGNRSVDLYARIKQDCWNLNPDVLTVLIGVNDVWHELGNRNGVELNRFENVMRTMLSETRERLPDMQIFLIEPFFLHGTAVEQLGYEGFKSVYDYAKVIKKLSEEFDCVFIKLQEKFNALAEKYGEENYLYDGVHPNLAGAKLISEEWLKVFYNKYKSEL